MPQLIYYRIAGNAVWLSMHAINAYVVQTSLQNKVHEKDPQVQKLAYMESRFMTIWNVWFQILYTALALTCDVLTVLNKDDLLPKNIKKVRDGFFSAVVVPASLSVFILFWPIFLYDRELLYPEFYDKVISFKSNLVIHAAILPVVLWELAFQPRNRPASHLKNLAVSVLVYFVYNVHIQMTYNERGIWPYPLMHQIYGTIYYLYIQLFIIALFLGAYYAQWPFCDFIWGNDKTVRKKVN